MAYDKQKVIDIALAEEGYLEKKTKEYLDDKTANAGSNNYTKYARDLDALGFFNGRKQGFAWCAVFVCWCFVQAYGVEGAKKLLCLPSNAANNCAAGCRSARNYYKSKGRLFDSPQPGDQIFFYSSDMSEVSHTGLVYKVDSQKVYTMEGNTSSTSGVVANGGMARTKSYSLSYSRLAGFGRPDYGAQATAKPETSAGNTSSNTSSNTTGNTTSYTLYTVKRGDTLWEIAENELGDGNRYKEIMQLNGLKSTMIRTGDVIKLPASGSAGKTETVSYTVKNGDSLWKIAKKQLGDGNRYKEIMTLNGLKSDTIHPGQVLKIPKK